MGYQITDDDISFCDAYTTKLCKRCGRLPDEDAIQSGRLGMCEAAARYNPKKSGSFKGWATYLIKKHLYQEHYKMRSNDASDQKMVAKFEDFRYSVGSFEDSVITKDLFYKALERATPYQRKILKEMFLNDKNPYDLEKETGKTHQSFYLIAQKAFKRINTHKMREEIAND
jgi:RNA polymerase sigma factor (sigma-70 family)